MTQQNPKDWKTYDQFAYGIDTNRLPATDALSGSSHAITFDDGRTVDVEPRPRGLIGLPVMFWLLCALALVVYLVAMVVALSRPTSPNIIYAVMALCQSGNVLFIAIESAVSLGLPPPFPQLDMPVRMAFDLFTAAAMVNAVCLHPRRLPGATWIALAAWAWAAPA